MLIMYVRYARATSLPTNQNAPRHVTVSVEVGWELGTPPPAKKNKCTSTFFVNLHYSNTSSLSPIQYNAYQYLICNTK